MLKQMLTRCKFNHCLNGTKVSDWYSSRAWETGLNGLRGEQ
jgi:hypothetical protein